jgi:hypothetical protein
LLGPDCRDVGESLGQTSRGATLSKQNDHRSEIGAVASKLLGRHPLGRPGPEPEMSCVQKRMVAAISAAQKIAIRLRYRGDSGVRLSPACLSRSRGTR